MKNPSKAKISSGLKTKNSESAREKLEGALSRMESRQTEVLGRAGENFRWTPIALCREAGVNKDTIYKRNPDNTRRFGDLLERLANLRKENTSKQNVCYTDQRVVNLTNEVGVLKRERLQIAAALKEKIAENSELLAEVSNQQAEANEWRRKYYLSVGRIVPKD